MKLAQIYCTSIKGDVFVWKWRSIDAQAVWSDAFAYFFECFEDARRHGYQPKYANGPITAPAEAGHAAGKNT